MNRIHIAWGFDLRTKNNGDDVMDTCVVCGSPIIKSQDIRANGYVNAVPWIQVRFVKVIDDKDDVAMELQFCGSMCLAKFASLTSGTLEKV